MKLEGLREPLPVWADAPRHCPQYPFPPYRFVAGLNAHPTADPAGHSFGAPEAHVISAPPDQWRKNESYLFGVDLYHQAFFWESHEAWEGLWQLLPRTDPQAQFYQALIKNSAAQIKANAGVINGVRVLSEDTLRHLRAVLASGACDANGRFMGLNLPELAEQVERHYGPAWREGSAVPLVLEGPPPRLRLS